MAESNATNLTPEQQAAALYWPYTAHIGIIAADTRNKVVNIKEWQKLDLDNVDYEANLQRGYYDNGIAIRLGRGLTNNGSTEKLLYSIALDFDGEDAINACFGSNWDNVIKVSKKSRIEWHGDKTTIHYILLANRPILNRRIKIKNSQLEIRCENQLLFASPSIHKDGNPYTPLGTDEIAILTDNQLLQLQALITNLCDDYMSDKDKQEYIAYLEKPDTILCEGERHNGILIMANSYFFRYKGEWANLTDDQRFERLIQYDKRHCKPSLYETSETEFRQIWNDTARKSMGKRQEESDKREAEAEAAQDKSSKYGYENPFGLISELNGNLFYQTNTKPPKFVVAHSETKRLIEVTIRSFESKSSKSTSSSSQQVRRGQSISIKPFLTCIPQKVIFHKSPIERIIKGNGDKYTIHFIGAQKSACMAIRHKTISEITAELKESGNVMADFGVDITLSMILKEFERKGLVEENTDMEMSGFFLDDKGKLFTSNIPDNDLAQPSKEELQDALNAIDELKKYYENRLELLASVIKWGIIAPLSFVLKIIHLPYLKWMALWGFSKTSKSSSGLIPLAIDGHHRDSSFVKAQGSIDSVPRLGELISKTTFPIVVNEVNLVDERMRHILEYMKTAIDSPILRDKFTNGGKSKSTISVPALSPLFLTSNFSMPIYNVAFMGRIIERDFPKSEMHNPSEATSKEFDAFLQNNLDRLKPLGRFRNWFLINNQEFIHDHNNSGDLGFSLLSKIHEHLSIAMPEWFKLKLSESQLEDSLSDNSVDVKRAFEAYITSSYDRFLPYWRLENPEQIGVKLDTETTSRLSKLIDDNRLPDIKRQKTDKKIIMIYKGILGELYKLGVTKDQLPNLRALADYMDCEYDRDPNGHCVVKDTWENIEGYFS